MLTDKVNDDDKVVVSKEELETISNITKSISTGMPVNFNDIKDFENKSLDTVFQNILRLYNYINELSSYSLSISRGDLNVPFPPRRNYLASGLKELHANLLHLCWKVNKITDGNYNQEIGYLGQVSDSFNKMLNSLLDRDEKIQELKKIIEAIKLSSDIMFYVIEIEGNNVIYNKADQHVNDIFDKFFVESAKHFIMRNKHGLKDYMEWEFYFDQEKKWFKVDSLAVTWIGNKKAYFHLLVDITSHKRTINSLEHQMNMDTMTGIYNHSFAISKTEELLKENKEFSICFMDLDGLKATNDKYGHSWGDKFLLKFIELVEKCLGGQDYFCRVGGDEFLLISPNTTESSIRSILNHILYKINVFNDSKLYPFEVSFSFGMEASPTTDNRSAIDVINSSDKKMYEHKKSRNRLREDYPKVVGDIQNSFSKIIDQNIKSKQSNNIPDEIKILTAITNIDSIKQSSDNKKDYGSNNYKSEMSPTVLQMLANAKKVVAERYKEDLPVNEK